MKKKSPVEKFWHCLKIFLTLMNMIILVLNGTSSTDVGIAEYFEMLVGRLIDANGMES